MIITRNMMILVMRKITRYYYFTLLNKIYDKNDNKGLGVGVGVCDYMPHKGNNVDNNEDNNNGDGDLNFMSSKKIMMKTIQAMMTTMLMISKR